MQHLTLNKNKWFVRLNMDEMGKRKIKSKNNRF